MLSMRIPNKPQSKLRTRSIYRGDHSHTVSMHLKVDNDVSPETLRRNNKANYPDSKIDRFRQSLRIVDFSHSAIKMRDQNKMDKKNSCGKQLKTERPLKQSVNLSNKKSNMNRTEKTSISILISKKDQCDDNTQIAVNQQELKELLTCLKKLEDDNAELKREIKLWNKGGTIAMALRQ